MNIIVLQQIQIFIFSPACHTGPANTHTLVSFLHKIGSYNKIKIDIELKLPYPVT
jgi:hypothetical protein